MPAPLRTTTASPHAPPWHVIVPGHGDPERTPQLAASLARVRAEVPGTECTVFVYAPALDARRLAPCRIVRRAGTWVDFMASEEAEGGAGGEEKRGNGAADRVAVLMDDVRVEAGTAARMAEAAGRWSVLSASVAPAWHHPIMMPMYSHHTRRGEVVFRKRKREECERRTGYADVLFVVFDRRAWACWRAQLDPVRNRLGWGYDVWFPHACARALPRGIGVADAARVRHVGKGRTYNGTSARREMDAWLEGKGGGNGRYERLRRPSTCVHHSKGPR